MVYFVNPFRCLAVICCYADTVFCFYSHQQNQNATSIALQSMLARSVIEPVYDYTVHNRTWSTLVILLRWMCQTADGTTFYNPQFPYLWNRFLFVFGDSSCDAPWIDTNPYQS